MDFTSAWFLLVMVVVGGGIAVLADNLGRKLGKSRLRLGKLRPRHTAMLLTAITGAIVTLATITVVTVLSAEVREWIIAGRNAVKQAKQLVGERDKMDAAVKKAYSELRDAEDQLRSRTAEIARLSAQLERAGLNLTESVSKEKSAKTRADQAATQLKERERRLKLLSADLKKASTQLESVRKSSAALDRIYKQLDTNYAKLNANYGKLNEQYESGLKQNRNLDEQNMELEKANEGLKKDVGVLNADINEGLRKLGDLSSKITNQERTLASLSQTAFKYREGAIGARTRPIIYRIGDDVARRDVGLALTYADAEKVIRSTINLAAEEVFRKTELSIGLLEVVQRSHTSDEIVGILSRKLLDSRGPATVVVRTPTNIFGDEEFVPVEVEVMNNPVVFRKGEVLGDVRIPGDQSVEQIIGAITAMLQKQVRDKAIQARMHGTENPNDSLGQVSPAETIKVVNIIKEVNRPVRVQAVAKSDTRASGPLEIEFRVR